MGLIGKLKAKVGGIVLSKILAAFVSKLAEGDFGEAPKRLYWWLAGKKTNIGFAFGAAWALLEYGTQSGFCAAQGYDCTAWSNSLGAVAAFLLAAGLYDGALRAKAPNKYAGLLLLLCLLPSMAFASPMADASLSWVLPTVVLLLPIAGMLLARTRAGVVACAQAFMFLLICSMGMACASMGGAQAQIGIGIKGPKGVDQGVVEGLVCRGDFTGAEVYAGDRGASRAEVTEVIERARKSTKGKPGCCAAEGKCAQ